MATGDHLDWPFFEPRHRKLAADLEAWAEANLTAPHDGPVDEVCREMVRRLGEDGWLKHAIGGSSYGASADEIDTRAVCLIRETLARYSGLADFAFAMQGLGSGAITLFGSSAQKDRYLARVAKGSAIAAFALSEPEAGSDAGALQCEASHDGGDYVLNGEKTFISNGGIADFYVMFARTGEAPGAKGITAFIVEPDAAGFEIAGRIEVIAPHPLARLKFTGCRIAESQRIGNPGEGFKVAMATLDIFRASVAAAALGFARRALEEALRRATSRKMFGQTLSSFQLTQAKLADMAVGIDAAALLTYRGLAARPRPPRNGGSGDGQDERYRDGAEGH
jgi:acyl-CoA dehydrogenase